MVAVAPAVMMQGGLSAARILVGIALEVADRRFCRRINAADRLHGVRY